MRLPGPHPLAERPTRPGRTADAGLRRVQAMVQGCLARQRGDDLPGGLPEQPVLDVRPYPVAHRPGRGEERQDFAAQLRDQLRRLHRGLGQQHHLCLERPDGRLSRPVRDGALSGKALGIPQPGKPRPVGVPPEPDPTGNRAHGRARLGAEADQVRLFLLRRKLLIPLAGTAASGPTGPAPDRAIPTHRHPDRHRQSRERCRIGGIDPVSSVPGARVAQPRRAVGP
ncbi:hypothetical protein D3C76_1147820 [compost metagenome]